MHQHISYSERRSEAIHRIFDLLDGLEQVRRSMESGKILPKTFTLLAGRYAERIRQAAVYGESNSAPRAASGSDISAA